ncbi:MAG: hypothetical protein WCL34_11910 [Methylococcaceae bacterium]
MTTSTTLKPAPFVARENSIINFHPSIIIDAHNHKKSVVLPYDEWEKILEIMEEFDEIRAYENAKAETDEFVPFEKAVQEIYAGKNN